MQSHLKTALTSDDIVFVLVPSYLKYLDIDQSVAGARLETRGHGDLTPTHWNSDNTPIAPMTPRVASQETVGG